MNTTVTSTPTAGSKTSQETTDAFGPNGVERRRRKRAKISAPVRVRTVDSPTAFEEVCKSVDVSRDGLLFLTSHSGYWPGQPLEVTFPYSTDASALNQAQAAEVVRVFENGEGQFGIGVQFAVAKLAKREVKSDSLGGGTVSPTPAGQKAASVVLAIEPDERMGDIMRGLLQKDGYTVIIVASAQAALDVLKTTVPAAFITEVENSDMSGHDLCLIIKRNDRLQHVPVILITQSGQPSEYAASHELGAVVCMAKPFSPERLLNVIRLVAPPPAQRSIYGARLQPSAVEREL
jgi:two-component system, chemotaxis family, chemotaxis protein CheY